MTARFLVMAVMLAVSGMRTDAQELASDLNQLRVLVKPGDSLTVIDTGGQRVQGKLVQVDASAMALELPDKQQRQFDGPMVDTVEKRGGDSLKNGALIGLIAGSVVGVVGGIGVAHDYGGSATGQAVGYGLLYGGLGAAIGTGIDALIRGRRVIYARSKTTVSVAPLLDHQHRGLALTLRH